MNAETPNLDRELCAALPQLRRGAIRLAGRDAADLVSATCVDALAAIRRGAVAWRGVAAFRAWALALLRNRSAKMRLAAGALKRGAGVAVTLSLDHAIEPVGVDADPALAVAIRRTLSRLDADTLGVVRDCVEGLTVRESAERRGVGVATAHRRLETARVALSVFA